MTADPVNEIHLFACRSEQNGREDCPIGASDWLMGFQKQSVSVLPDKICQSTVISLAIEICGLPCSVVDEGNSLWVTGGGEGAARRHSWSGGALAVAPPPVFVAPTPAPRPPSPASLMKLPSLRQRGEGSASGFRASGVPAAAAAASSAAAATSSGSGGGSGGVGGGSRSGCGGGSGGGGCGVWQGPSAAAVQFPNTFAHLPCARVRRSTP